MHFQRVFGQAFRLETKIAAVVFGLVLLAMLVAFAESWRRRRRGRGASQVAEHSKLELGYVAVLTGLVIFLMAFSVTKTNAFFTDPRPDLTVKVTAYQWCWRFSYAGQPVSVTGQCQQGHPPTLMLPAARTVKVELTSTDVVHSFWVPGLDFKVDVYPAHVNTFTFTLRQGRWRGHCAQLCGLYHAWMLFNLQAIAPARFDAWLHARGGSATAVRPLWPAPSRGCSCGPPPGGPARWTG
jgi:cytochrome c oxidase subunit 2